MAILKKIKKAATDYGRNVVGGAKIVGSEAKKIVSTAKDVILSSTRDLPAAVVASTGRSALPPVTPVAPRTPAQLAEGKNVDLKGKPISTTGGNSQSSSNALVPGQFGGSTTPTQTKPVIKGGGQSSSFESLADDSIMLRAGFGSDTNFANFSSQSPSLSQGTKSTPTSNVINTPTLGAQNTKLTFPEPEALDYSMDIPGVIDMTDSRTEIEAEEKKTQEDYIKGLLKDFNEKESAVDIDRKLQRELGIKEKQQLVSDLTGQLNAVVNKGQANQLSLIGQGRGIPEAIIGGQQAQIGRETAIAALPIQAMLSAAQGDLEMANESLDRLFKIYSQEAENEYRFRTEQRKMVYEFLTTDQKKRLEKLDKEDARKLQIQDAMWADGKAYAKMAFANGQSTLGGQIMKLNPQSPTYMQDLTKLISNIKDPRLTLDIENAKLQNAKLQKEIALLGEPTAKEKKEEAELLRSKQGQNQVLTDKVNLIDSLLENSGMSARVGTGILSRTPRGFWGTLGKAVTGVGALQLPGDALAKVSGSGQQFAGGVHKLTSQEFLNALIGAKQQGATFGALTDREGDALRAAATQLNDWEIKDGNGLGTGVWNIDESSFKAELNNLKRLANLGIQRASGSVLQQDEDSLLNSLFAPENQPLDPANYYSN